MSIPTTTAISEPGIFLLMNGQTMRMARHTTPTITACQFIVPIFPAMAFTLSTVSMVTVPAGKVSPRKSFICPMRIVTAMPAVKPVVMV